MALDREGNVYLTGTTTSFDLGTPGAFQPHRASSEIFSVDRVSTKLRPIPLPTGARIEGLTSDPQNPGTVYVVTDRGLWKTTDGGVTWAKVTQATATVASIAITLLTALTWMFIRHKKPPAK